jgi:Phage integrase, N-terminal SAM-like domain
VAFLNLGDVRRGIAPPPPRRVLPTPVVQLNRAVAVGRAHSQQAELALVDALLADPALRDYHLLPGVRGDLLARLGRGAEARREFQRAASLTRNAAERAFLHRRADELAVAGGSGMTLGESARDFLERADLDAGTLRSYGQTLRRLRLALGDELPLASLTADHVARVFGTAWADAASRTWNRHRSAVRSFGSWAALPDLGRGPRPAGRPPTTGSVDRARPARGALERP